LGTSPRWLPRLAIEAIHLDQIRAHGGLPGIRDEGALESALARPRNKRAYQPDADLHLLAAGYVFGLARSHPFNDGNKRIAFIAAAVFLTLNGFELIADEVEVVEVFLALAAGSIGEEELATWLRNNSIRR
jgi:death on curing protein